LTNTLIKDYYTYILTYLLNSALHFVDSIDWCHISRRQRDDVLDKLVRKSICAAARHGHTGFVRPTLAVRAHACSQIGYAESVTCTFFQKIMDIS